MDPVSPDCRHQGQSLIRNDFPLSAQICLVIVPLNCPLRSSRGLTSSLLIALFKQIDSLLRRIVMFQSNKVRTHLAQVWNAGLVDWPQGAITTSQHNKSAEIKETNSRGNHADPRVSKSDGCWWWSRRPPADGLLSYTTRMLEQHLVTKTFTWETRCYSARFSAVRIDSRSFSSAGRNRNSRPVPHVAPVKGHSGGPCGSLTLPHLPLLTSYLH